MLFIQTSDTSYYYDLVKKTYYKTKIGEKKLDHNHDKYITNLEFHNLTVENFATRQMQNQELQLILLTS